MLFFFSFTNEFCNTSSQFDIRTTSCHVSGDGYGTFLSGLGDDSCFSCMVLSIQNIMRNISLGQ